MVYVPAALNRVELLDIGNMTTCLVANPAVSRWIGSHGRLDIASPHSGNVIPHVQRHPADLHLGSMRFSGACCKASPGL